MGAFIRDVETDHLARYPEERDIMLPFLANFDVTWAKRRLAFGSSLSVYFLRPERHMEDAFGFENEIMAVYSPYPTLEPRTVQAIDQFLSDEPARGRVDNMTVFLISEVSDPGSWARQYMTSNLGARLIAGFAAQALRGAHADPWHVRSTLASQLYQRDLFDYRLPIQNDFFFFGREDLIFDLYNAFRRSENKGLFGLRKTGKTSLLFKLDRRIRASQDGYLLYFDCKYPPIRTLRWDGLLRRLAAEIGSALGVQASREDENAADAFLRVVSACPDSKRLVIVFDEIEYIGPYSTLDRHWKEEFVPFWQTIWTCQSRHRNLSVIVAGVNPAIVEKDLIDGVQNPLFGIVPPQYLCGLRTEELKRMLRNLGRRMGLRFSGEAAMYLEARYGGHPLLTRIACSLTHRYLRDAGMILPMDVDVEYLRDTEDQRDAELSFYSRHVVSELRQFYPDEYELLEKIACGQLADYLEFASEPEYTAHLTNYGLLLRDVAGRPQISIPVVGKFLGLEAARREGRKTILKVVPSERRVNWLGGRIEAINSNLDALQRGIARNNLPCLFGPSSYPESHKFYSMSVCDSENSFSAFMNTCNRCFVEAIEAYGKSIGRPDYFWRDIANAYPALIEALKRVKVYRHHRVHIRLNEQTDAALSSFLRKDLEGRAPASVDDLWFVLQQCVLDELLTAILIEADKIS